MPVQQCAGCGTERRGDLQVCVHCELPFPDATDVELAVPRPAAPSATQSHGTVMLGLLGGFALLALLLSLSVRGVGPYQARVLRTTPRDAGHVELAVEITNAGRKAGHAHCMLGRVNTRTGDRTPDHQFLSSRIAPGATVTETVLVPVARDVATTGAVTC